jgi:predicted nucleic-acid-binding Zn-ribbon protein
MLDMRFLGDNELAGAIEGLAPLETYVCEPCGFTEWFMRTPPATTDPARGVYAIRDEHRALSCVQCGASDHHLVARMHEHNAYGPVTWPLTQIGGGFACTACNRCGKLEWYASAAVHDLCMAEPCPRCSGTRWEVEALEQANLGYRRYPVAMVAGEDVGQFRLRVCAPCGYTDWYATGIDRALADDRCQIERVMAPARFGPGGGPYR